MAKIIEVVLELLKLLYDTTLIPQNNLENEKLKSRETLELIQVRKRIGCDSGSGGST